jgi:hypothetical protein
MEGCACFLLPGLLVLGVWAIALGVIALTGSGPRVGEPRRVAVLARKAGGVLCIVVGLVFLGADALLLTADYWFPRPRAEPAPTRAVQVP